MSNSRRPREVGQPGQAHLARGNSSFANPLEGAGRLADHQRQQLDLKGGGAQGIREAMTPSSVCAGDHELMRQGLSPGMPQESPRRPKGEMDARSASSSCASS